MQTIGKMIEGRTLAVLSDQECNILLEVETMIQVRQLAHATIPAGALAPAATPSCSRGGNAVAAERIHAVTGAATETDGRRHPWRAAIAAEVQAKTTARSAAATETGKPICRICGKPITRKKGSLGITPKCCSKKCLKEFKRIYARDNWRAKHGKKHVERGASSVERANPSDPFLSDYQRKDLMARREKLIAASAQKHADD